MTKILIITSKADLTSDFVVKKLQERGIDFFRFNTEELTKTCDFIIDFQRNKYLIVDKISGLKYNLKEFESVYYRRPELPEFDSVDLSPEEILFLKNEVYFTLEGIYKALRNANWISPVYSIREAENKIYQLELADEIGFKIPNSIVTNSYEALDSFYTNQKGTCIIKPVKSGLIGSENSSKIVFTSLLNQKPENQKQIELAPNFIQSQIHKKGDVRVTMVGDSCFATLIHSQNHVETKVDWRKGEHHLEHSKIDIPKSVVRKCSILMEKLNLRFAAIDFILDINDEYYFLEINPNGQWAWIERNTGYEISSAIVSLLSNEMAS